MRIKFQWPTFLITSLCFMLLFSLGFIILPQNKGFILEHEREIAIEDAGPHNGGCKTTAYPFFKDFADAKMIFRKRVLHPGSSIGYHLQQEQEIYYIIKGNGVFTLNGKAIQVTTGDALLTLPGSSHGLKPADNNDLAVLIAYENK